MLNTDCNLLFTSAYSKKQKAEALARWYEDLANNSLELLQRAQVIVQTVTSEFEDAPSREQFMLWMENNSPGLAGRMIPYDNYAVTFADFVYSGICSVYEGVDSTYLSNIELKDLADDTITDFNSRYDFNTFFQEVSKSIIDGCQCVVEYAAALGATIGNTVAEKMQLYRDKIARYFETGYSTSTSGSSYLTGLLESNATVDQVVEAINTISAVEKMVPESQEFVYPNSTDASMFLGINPIGIITIGLGLTNAVSTVVRAAAKVVVGITKTLIKVGSVIFKGMASLLGIKINTADLYVRDTAATFRGVDGWAIVGHHSKGNFPAIDSTTVTKLEITDSDINAVSMDPEIQLDFVFGTIIIKNISLMSSLSSGIDCDFDIYCYIQPVRYDAFAFLGDPAALDTIESCKSTYNKFISTLMQNDIFVEIGSSSKRDEQYFYSCAIFSYLMLQGLSLSFVDDNSSLTEWQLELAYWIAAYTKVLGLSYSSDPLTNKDFVALFSGYDGSVFQPYPVLSTKVSGLNQNELLPVSRMSAILGGYLVNRMQRKAYPLSYPFFPYTPSVTGVDAVYGIYSDADLVDKYSSIVGNGVLAIVATVLVAYTGLKISKAISTYALKFNGLTYAIEGKLASGESIPESTMKNYRRMRRVLKMLGVSQGGLMTNSSTAATLANTVASTVDTISSSAEGKIYRSITGQPL